MLQLTLLILYLEHHKKISPWGINKGILIRFDSIRFDSIRFDSIRFDSIRFDSIRFDSIRFDSIRFDSIRSNLTNFSHIKYFREITLFI